MDSNYGNVEPEATYTNHDIRLATRAKLLGRARLPGTFSRAVTHAMPHKLANLWHRFIGLKMSDTMKRIKELKEQKISVTEEQHQLKFLQKATRIDNNFPGWKAFKKNYA